MTRDPETLNELRARIGLPPLGGRRRTWRQTARLIRDFVLSALIIGLLVAAAWALLLWRAG